MPAKCIRDCKHIPVNFISAMTRAMRHNWEMELASEAGKLIRGDLNAALATEGGGTSGAQKEVRASGSVAGAVGAEAAQRSDKEANAHGC